MPVKLPAVRPLPLDPAQEPAASRATRCLHDNRNPLRPQLLVKRLHRRRRKEGRDGRERDKPFDLAFVSLHLIVGFETLKTVVIMKMHPLQGPGG